jgi:hypothetical protein
MAKFDSSVIDDQPQDRTCNMPDCNLVGTISDNNRGGGPWWCVYHYRQRDGRNFTRGEKRELMDISYAYNNGRRDYGTGAMETREEMLSRICLAKKSSVAS